MISALLGDSSLEYTAAGDLRNSTQTAGLSGIRPGFVLQPWKLFCAGILDGKEVRPVGRETRSG